jgi:hypothetical protein
MRKFALMLFLAALPGFAKAVVFWQPGFPTVASQPVGRDTLVKALGGMEPVFAGIDGLKDPVTLEGADLLVLPYGSAFPTEAWSGILAYIRAGGNVAVLGGQAFRVPVTGANGRFTQAPPQDTYARDMGIQHTYEAPIQDKDKDNVRFAWRAEYAFLRPLAVHARRFFVLEGRVSGLGFALNGEGLEVAAPVVVMDRASGIARRAARFRPRGGLLGFGRRHFPDRAGGRLCAPGRHGVLARDAVLHPQAGRARQSAGPPAQHGPGTRQQAARG